MTITGKKRIKLTPDGVLDKISEYDIFRFYISDKSWKLNVPMLSPFRQENNPSFIIGNKHGRLSFIDFADTSLRGDCFTFVKQLHNLSTMDDVLRLIDRDFSLGISSKPTGDYKKIVAEYKQPEELGKRYSLIQVVTRKFTNEELAYWNQYYQDVQDLRDNNVTLNNYRVFLGKSIEDFFSFLCFCCCVKCCQRIQQGDPMSLPPRRTERKPCRTMRSPR